MTEAGHSVLRLPPYHPDLDPIELVWASLKQYVAERNVDFNIKHITKLNEETSLLRYENNCLSLKYDDLEQATRVNNLRICQLKEMPQENLANEVIRVIKSHLGVTVDHNEILLCTSIGKMKVNNSRGVLFKLKNIKKKQEISNKKKNFKGTGIVVKEDLTGHRVKVMEAAIEKTSLSSVWIYV
nr:unnamed protein product [Callosobruchus chinensis]